MNNIRFYDGYWYCYANATAMLLSSIGEEISPHLIEPLTGVGLGAFISSEGLLFFSGLNGLPDKGVSKALEILGFSFEEKSIDNPEIDISTLLNEVLGRGPTILGPLDMVYLVYNPKRPKYEGVDHYVLAYKIEDTKVYVYDPAGYAKVFISVEYLTKAWKAERVFYRRGYFRYWTSPKRNSNPLEDEIYSKALSFFKDLYLDSDNLAKKENRLNDDKAIREIARLSRKKQLTENQMGFLTGFALPLGTKRALDFSDLFKGKNDNLAKLKKEQSILFGKAHTLAILSDWEKVADVIEEIAEVEKQIKESILKYET